MHLRMDPETTPMEPIENIAELSEEITEWDHEAYLRVVDTRLSPEQISRLVKPPQVYPREKAVLAIHWHPEFIPLEIVKKRIDATFPNRKTDLIIPTQHNQILSLDGYSGVEVDCYSAGFNRKVQLLLHFREDRNERAGVLRSMLDHTFRYRSGQLFEFIDSIVDPELEERLQEAAAETGANPDLVQFVRVYTGKLKKLLMEHEDLTPPEMIKNKILRDYFDMLRDLYPDRLINRAQFLLKAVKQVVKRNFSLQYFYRTSEIIEEARSVGCGVVIPHPEQFWPILMADYDVDGFEVWNPQSREYTEFLINVVNRRNKEVDRDRRLLIFMGDDTHMGEKAKDPERQDREKSAREIGVQPAWDEWAIQKSLIVADVDRVKVIDEYKARLG